MRRYALLTEPFREPGGGVIRKIMLCEADGGVYLFGYAGIGDLCCCSSERFYEEPEDLHDDWDGLIDDSGWRDLEDALPDCQQDAFLPLRLKGRDTGHPLRGQYEILADGVWTDYDPRAGRED